MKTAMIRRIAWGILVLIGLGVESAWAQRYPERRVLRSGNKLYEKEQYAEAETQYRKAQDMNPTYEGLFNLADVLYKQKRYEEALNILKQIARDDVAGMHAPDAYYNLGNTYFQMKKLPEAAEAYKNTLRRNPNDDEARYNLASVLALMKQNNNQNNNQNNQNNQNQNNQNNNQNQNQNQNNPNDQNNQKQPPKKDQGDGNNDQQDQNKDKNNDQNQNQDGQQNPDQNGQNPQGQNPEQGDGQSQPNRMSREEADRMLDAVQSNEDNTKKKVEARKARAVAPSGKNW